MFGVAGYGFDGEEYIGITQNHLNSLVTYYNDLDIYLRPQEYLPKLSNIKRFNQFDGVHGEIGKAEKPFFLKLLGGE